MSNRIIEQYSQKFNLDNNSDKFLAEIVEETSFKPQKEIWRGIILGDKKKTGSIIFDGIYKNKPAILKIQHLRPEIDEPKIIAKFYQNSKSKKIFVPKILIHKDWNQKKQYGYFIAEKISYPKIYPSGVVTEKQMKEFCDLFQEYKTKIKTKPGWFKKENYEKDAIKFNLSRVNNWVKIAKNSGKLKSEFYQPKVALYKKIIKDNCQNQPMDFVHGHLSPHDILKASFKKYYLVSNMLWSWRPKWYELAFNIWVNINSMGPDVNQQEVKDQIKKWLKFYQKIPITKKDANFKKWIEINLLERALGSMLVDFGSINYPVEKQKQAKYGFYLWNLIFDKIAKSITIKDSITKLQPNYLSNSARELAKAAIKKGAIQKITELSSLINLLKKRKLKIIVEIGSAKGGTFYAWCKIAEPDATIISIDLPGGNFGGGYPINDIKKFKKYGKKKQKLYFLRKDSHKIKTKRELEKILDNRKVDFLMIDGDHTYQGVKQDWKLYSNLVKKNGLIAFHDILPHEKELECEVDKLWNEIRVNLKHVEFTDKKDDRGWGQWGGIGVVYK